MLRQSSRRRGRTGLRGRRRRPGRRWDLREHRGRRVDARQAPQAGLQLLNLLLLLLLLGVGELDDHGRGAALHGLRVVHALDGRDGVLPGGEGHEGAACEGAVTLGTVNVLN